MVFIFSNIAPKTDVFFLHGPICSKNTCDFRNSRIQFKHKENKLKIIINNLCTQSKCSILKFYFLWRNLKIIKKITKIINNTNQNITLNSLSSSISFTTSTDTLPSTVCSTISNSILLAITK